DTTLGKRAFTIMVISTAAACFGAVLSGSQHGTNAIFEDLGTLLMIAASAAGVTALVLGITATAKNLSQKFGIITIILGIIAPLLMLILLGITSG
ncbi:MAG: hypothetical protein FWG47_04720, partial [Propionibacteriaceae bacterium]|nr:hypothetical protein [Propionibacteriaceae bacterium]